MVLLKTPHLSFESYVLGLETIAVSPLYFLILLVVVTVALYITFYMVQTAFTRSLAILFITAAVFISRLVVVCFLNLIVCLVTFPILLMEL